MKKILFLLTLFILPLVRPSHAFAATQESPHLILNFAQMNELDWAAPEEAWQTQVKPKVENEISLMRSTLKIEGDAHVILGWSTLMEYMNFPMDTPSPDSPYAVKMRRILEVANELDFPVFVPLNGFQWWDELPELYNWWDPDGMHTDPKFFSRQNNPEDFKRRFIAGYDPDNKWNVEWQDPQTPMKLNYRNWGGGGFRLAPPPNLTANPKVEVTYRFVQAAREKVIVNEIVKEYAKWQSVGKEDLFIGLSIGTEVSLNASVTPSDEFKAYGIRSTADSGKSKTEVVQTYLEDNAYQINRSGIPKNKIYTHVLGEQDPSDPHYGPYALSAFNLYSNPGVSLYGYANDPLTSKQWGQAVSTYGMPVWGAMEYTSSPTLKGLTTTLSSARIVDIYNWDQIQGTATTAILKSTLTASIPAQTACDSSSTVLHVQTGARAKLNAQEIVATDLESLPHGTYTWFVEKQCSGGRKEYSEPKVLYVPLPPPVDTTPAWVKWYLNITNG